MNPPLQNRVTEILGVDYPIVQAPMGYIARARLASAVSNAGALGIIETSSGQLDDVRLEIEKMRDLTDKPFGVNIAQMLVRDLSIVDFVHDNGVRFVTTSAGDPARYTDALHEAGITVFHVVPNLRAALKAVAAGVDGIVAEGGEGGGFKSLRDVATMVLLPLVCSKVDVPVIAAGGITDGRSMAAAFALGAEGVQMGTHGVGGGVAGARQLQATDRRQRGDGHGDAQPLPQAGVPGARHRVLGGAGAVGRGGGHARARQPPAPLLRRRPRRRVRVRRAGGRAHRGVVPVQEIVEETIAEFHATIATLAERYR